MLGAPQPDTTSQVRCGADRRQVWRQGCDTRRVTGPPVNMCHLGAAPGQEVGVQAYVSVVVDPVSVEVVVMKTRAALLRDTPGAWGIAELELDGPAPGEVLVEMAASGLCHSDDHVARGHLQAARLPLVGGHEGTGLVCALGEGVRGLTVGDHVVTSFIPSCGGCRWCAEGMQSLCDNGAPIRMGTQLDGTCRLHDRASTEVATTACLVTLRMASVRPGVDALSLAMQKKAFREPCTAMMSAREAVPDGAVHVPGRRVEGRRADHAKVRRRRRRSGLSRPARW